MYARSWLQAPRKPGRHGPLKEAGLAAKRPTEADAASPGSWARLEVFHTPNMSPILTFHPSQCYFDMILEKVSYNNIFM
jgi:hypothetical protein